MKTKKREVKTLVAIQTDYYNMQEMRCKPDIIKLMKPDAVIDEDKSVKWNREQVRLNNEKYHEEVARLNSLKNKARDEIMEDIYAYIQDEVGHEISREKAMIIWQYVYSKYHAEGIKRIIAELTEMIDEVLIKIL